MNQWEDVMKKHAKSFYLASLFFPQHLMPRVKALYALCRWLDDAVDEAPSQNQALIELEKITQDLTSDRPQMPVNSLYKENNLDVGYIEDLIQGAREDLQVVRIQTSVELVQYAYKVAGTVGLAMYDLMGVKDPIARANAVDLGIAMQITNICRDVKEDLERNRIYVPLELLNKHGITEKQFCNHNYNPHQLTEAMTELVELADCYYYSASLAFNSIPSRTRGAIIIATRLYRSIGLKLIQTGGNPMLGRVFLNRREKLLCVTSGLLQWGLSLFKKPNISHDNRLHQGLERWQKTRGFGFDLP